MDERELEAKMAQDRKERGRRAIMEAIRSVLVQRGSADVFYVCQQIQGGAWACGYCHKGLLGVNPQEGDYCSCGAVVNGVERGPAPKTFSAVNF